MRMLSLALVIAFAGPALSDCICNHLPCPCRSGMAAGPFCPRVELFCPLKIDPLDRCQCA
jgi:hypothetical protein